MGDKELDDGKAYELHAFMKHYRQSGRREDTDSQLKDLWIKCNDAVLAAERLLAGGEKRDRPISIATYFMDRVKAIDRPMRDAAEKKHGNKQDISLDERRKYIEPRGRRTWTTLALGGAPISVEFMKVT